MQHISERAAGLDSKNSPSQSLDNSCVATHPYSYKVPSPPRIMIPPLGFYDNASLRDLVFDPTSSPGFETNVAEFLETVTFANYSLKSATMDWKYEQRQEAQKILPFLYLGPVSMARNGKFLQSEGITMILAVRTKLSARLGLLRSKVAEDLGLETMIIDVADSQGLISSFSQAAGAINHHLLSKFRDMTSVNPDIRIAAENVKRQDWDMPHRSPESPGQPTLPGKILVYCESGNERSSIVMAAYMMSMYSLDLVSAIQLIQSQRFCVIFDDAAKTLLQSYQNILEAKRDVVRFNLHSEMKTLGPWKEGFSIYEAKGRLNKRSIDDTHDDDMDLESDVENYDRGRFQSRGEVAPFLDG
ncbi:hypothetical protein MMC09_006038 [Bachmanniomyces sp. S44760]|nr:hypothetical protein [Bachmanniomyces sp. S44760]